MPSAARSLRRFLLAADDEHLRQEIDELLDDPSTFPDLAALDSYWSGVTGEPPGEVVHVTYDAFVHGVALAADITRAEADEATEAVLEALRDRLGPKECAHLANRLPEHLRKFMLKSRRRSATHLSREELVERVCLHLDVGVADALKRIRSVYAVLERMVATGAPEEREHLLRVMPPELLKVLKPPALAARA